MRVVPWDGPGDEAESPEDEGGGGTLNAMRSWLVSGVHVFVVDPRRRFGSHRRARELLVVETPASHEASERWQTLAAALHRHSVRDGLASLSRAERKIITLAYLEGRSNREIAALLGVSVSTVRRRLWVALEHLDTFLRRSGAWLAALLLGALAYVNGQVARVGRLASGPGATDRAQLVAASVAVGALSLAAVGIATLAHPGTSTHAMTVTNGIKAPPDVQFTGPLVAVSHGPGVVTGLITPSGAAITGAATVLTQTTQAPATTKTAGTNGCHGNPTSAPPTVPVGPRGTHPGGSPVTHPGRGGCKAL